MPGDGDPALPTTAPEQWTVPGEVPSLELASALMQFGIDRHLNKQAMNAVPALARAESMFVQLSGDDSPQAVLARTHHAVALVKVGRNGQALPLLLRVINVMEKTPVDDATYTLALANAAQLVARKGDAELATKYLDRSRRLMVRIRQ